VYSPATDSTAGSGNTESWFDRNVVIPANTLKAGSVIRLRWKVCATAVTTGGDTLTCRAAIGAAAGAAAAVLVATSGAVAVNANDIYVGQAEVIVKAVGAPGTFDAWGSHAVFAAAGGNMTTYEADGSNIDTTAALTVGLTFDWSTADTGNTAVLEMISVDVIVP